jgi:hypothetical protein
VVRATVNRSIDGPASETTYDVLLIVLAGAAIATDGVNVGFGSSQLDVN